MSGRTQGLCPEVSVLDMDLVEDGLQVCNVRNLLSTLYHANYLGAFFFFWLYHVASLGPLPGIEPMPPVIEARSLNHRITGKIPGVFF